MLFLYRYKLELIIYLEEELEIDFLLTDTIYGRAKVKKNVKTVCLWLGANVMVEYSFDEARSLLSKNLENAIVNLKKFVSGGYFPDYHF